MKFKKTVKIKVISNIKIPESTILNSSLAMILKENLFRIMSFLNKIISINSQF